LDVVISNENLTCFTDGCERMSKLRSALNKTAKSSVSAITFDILRAQMDPKSREEKKMLHSIHSQLLENVLALVKDEIVLLLHEENVEQKLSKLDDACKLSLAESTEVIWRPNGSPMDDVAAHLLPGISVTHQRLKVLLDDTEFETDRMMRAVLERRRFIENVKTTLEENTMRLLKATEESTVASD